MSLPIVIIFERHWDTTPKSVVKDLIPRLYRRGYQTFCFDAPQNVSLKEIFDRQKHNIECYSKIEAVVEKTLREAGITIPLNQIGYGTLTSIIRGCVSTTGCNDLALKVKELAACRMLGDIFRLAEQLSMSLKGIDLDSNPYDKITSSPLSEKMELLERNGNQIIATMIQNLIKIRNQGEGVIFSCGAFHAKGLVEAFKKQGLQDEVLYYFPHSPTRFDEGIDDVAYMLTKNEGVLDNHTHLLKEEDVPLFSRRVVKEVSEKTRYIKEITDPNSHSDFLSKRFRANFRVFLRPGYHLDALVDVRKVSDWEEVKKLAEASGVQTDIVSLKGQNYLAIPNVNSRDIAEKIRKI